MAGKTVSGENTRGLGGWRRGKLESDMKRNGRVLCDEEKATELP